MRSNAGSDKINFKSNVVCWVFPKGIRLRLAGLKSGLMKRLMVENRIIELFLWLMIILVKWAFLVKWLAAFIVYFKLFMKYLIVDCFNIYIYLLFLFILPPFALRHLTISFHLFDFLVSPWGVGFVLTFSAISGATAGLQFVTKQ